jgi:hypothetical protein
MVLAVTVFTLPRIDRRWRRVPTAVLLLALLMSCTGAARTDRGHELKAANTVSVASGLRHQA